VSYIDNDIDGLLAFCDGSCFSRFAKAVRALVAKRDALIADRTALIAECDGLRSEREIYWRIKDEQIAELAAMRQQRDEAVELYTDLQRRLSGSAPPRAAFLSGDATQKEGGGA
jgi:hypothetical protein